MAYGSVINKTSICSLYYVLFGENQSYYVEYFGVGDISNSNYFPFLLLFFSFPFPVCIFYWYEVETFAVENM